MDHPSHNPVVLALSDPQLAYIDALVVTRLYGSDRIEVIVHLIQRGIQEACANHHISELLWDDEPVGGFRPREDEPQLPLDKPF